jgi:hypothetical protein
LDRVKIASSWLFPPGVRCKVAGMLVPALLGSTHVTPMVMRTTVS